MGAVRRIVVGVHGSLGSLQALRWAADEARERQAPARAGHRLGTAGRGFRRTLPSLPLPAHRCGARRPSKRLADAFDAGLGGVPEDVHVQARVERGEAGPVLVDVAGQPGDLLVIGTGRRYPVGRALRRSVGRYCLAHAQCPVLAVPPSALMDEMRARPG